MTTRHGRSVGVVVGLVAILSCSGGDISGLDFDCGPPLCLPPGTLTFFVTLTNATESPADLLMEGEAPPCCRVEPNSSRTVSIVRSPVDFRAEVDGRIVATARCSVTSAYAGSAAVVFSAPDQLTCQGW